METNERLWRLMRPMLSREALKSAPLEPLQAQTLANRSVDFADMPSWLAADSSLIHDPALLPDLHLAADRINQAIAEHELIGIVGDCDVDGLTATAILTETLGKLGARLTRPIIAPRIDDGRGLTQDAVRKLKERGARLCVTVDNGSSSVAEVRALQEAGIATIITDHHHIPDEAPQAHALVNPQRADSQYPNPDISGAGVAVQFARVLLGNPPLDEPFLAGLIDLAGLGTLADVVRLTAENHALVAMALRRLRAQPRPGIRALLALAKIDPATICARDIGYAIAPRLNAAGRLGDPRIALELLLTHDGDEARMLALELHQLNIDRQSATELMLGSAREQAIMQMQRGDAIIFVEGADWPMGIVGLVAGRLADEYDTLAVAVATHGNSCRASLRGPRSFHIAEALTSFTPPLAQAGGHAQAGGFSTTVDQLPALRDHLARRYLAAKQQPGDGALREPLEVDISLSFDKITWDRARMIQALEPFGQGFPEPSFVSERAKILRAWPVGNGKHLKIVAEQQGARRSFFWPKAGPRLEEVKPGALADIAWRFPSGAIRNAQPEPTVVELFPLRMLEDSAKMANDV